MTEYDTGLYYFKYNASELEFYKMTVRVKECIATLLGAVETEDVDPAPMFGAPRLRRIAAVRDPRPKRRATAGKTMKRQAARSSLQSLEAKRSERAQSEAHRRAGRAEIPPPIFRFSVVLSLLYIYTRGKKEVRVMSEAMVTGRMTTEKKARGGRILQRDGLNASQAINLLYDRVISDGSAEFLTGKSVSPLATAWHNAAQFVDSLSEKRTSRFDAMSDREIRIERLQKRGLM